MEADTIVRTIDLVQQPGAPHGLSRVSHKDTGAANYVFDDTSGRGVVAYVVDTGIRLTHSVWPPLHVHETFHPNTSNRNLVVGQASAQTSLIPMYVFLF